MLRVGDPRIVLPRRGAGIAGALFLTGLLLVASRSAAQAQDAGAAADVTTGVDEAEQRRLLAEQAFAEGTEAYDRGDYATAAARFEAAHQAQPHPNTLYNLARAYENLGDVQRALHVFAFYLRQVPRADNAGEVRARIEALRRRPMDVFVTSEPTGAVVRVPGAGVFSAPVSRTPVVLHLAPGTYDLLFEREGYHHAIRRITVAPGEVQTLVQTLRSTATVRPPTNYERVLARRSQQLVSARLSFLPGVSRPWEVSAFMPVLGFEVAGFFRRHFSVQAHYASIISLGSPTQQAFAVFTGEAGWVFTVDDVDLGLYLLGGTAWGCAADCTIAGATVRREWWPLLGASIHVDWVLTPHFAVGAVFRLSARDARYDELSTYLLSYGGVTVNLLL